MVKIEYEPYYRHNHKCCEFICSVVYKNDIHVDVYKCGLCLVARRSNSPFSYTSHRYNKEGVMPSSSWIKQQALTIAFEILENEPTGGYKYKELL